MNSFCHQRPSESMRITKWVVPRLHLIAAAARGIVSGRRAAARRVSHRRPYPGSPADRRRRPGYRRRRPPDPHSPRTGNCPPRPGPRRCRHRRPPGRPGAATCQDSLGRPAACRSRCRAGLRRSWLRSVFISSRGALALYGALSRRWGSRHCRCPAAEPGAET